MQRKLEQNQRRASRNALLIKKGKTYMQQGIILPLVLLLGHRCLGRTERDCYGSEDKADSSLM